MGRITRRCLSRRITNARSTATVGRTPAGWAPSRRLDCSMRDSNRGSSAKSSSPRLEPRALEAAGGEGFPFRGVLYCGLMITADGPKALEYNVRFGDPETQAILRLFDGDFAEIALAVAQGRLSNEQSRRPLWPLWSDEAAT